MSLRLDQRPRHDQSLIHGAGQRVGFLAQCDLAARDAGNIEQIVDQPGQMDDLPLDDFLRPTYPRLGRFQAGEDMGGVADRRQRVAQLVAEHGEKLILAPVRLDQGLLGQLELADVLGGAETAEHPSRRVELQLGLLAHPLHLAVYHQAMIDVVGRAVQTGLPHAIDVIPVVRMHDREKRLIGERRALGNAEDTVIFVGPEQFIALDVEPPATDLADRLGALQIGLRFQQRGFRPLALGDVAQDDGEQPAALQFDLGKRGFDGKYLAVGSPAIQTAPIRQVAAGHAGTGEIADVFRMARAGILGQQRINRLAQRFGGG
jgi:hypothetical protein